MTSIPHRRKRSCLVISERFPRDQHANQLRVDVYPANIVTRLERAGYLVYRNASSAPQAKSFTVRVLLGTCEDTSRCRRVAAIILGAVR